MDKGIDTLCSDIVQDTSGADDTFNLSGEREDFQAELSEFGTQTAQDGLERPKRRIQLTDKGMAYQHQILYRNRSAAHGKLLIHINRVKSLNDQHVTMGELEQARDALDKARERFYEVHNRYDRTLESSEERDTSYKWFDKRDGEYQQCRIKICEQIHSLERELYCKTPSVKSNHTSRTSLSGKSKRSSVSSKTSSSSAHSRRVKAAAKAAKLEVQMKFLDKETEFKRLQIMKEIEMANAEKHAMMKIEEEDGSVCAREGLEDQFGGYSVDTSMVDKNSKGDPLTNTHAVKLESRSNLNPESPPFQRDVTIQGNPVTKSEELHSNLRVLQPNPPFISNYPGEAALQEMIKLQTKQTELSAMIANQQRIQSLPIQEPPSFNGNFFDYPIFIRAFETIIESRVSSDKERLYFLNKYTTGRANDVIKAFVTLNSEHGFDEAKKLLSQRFGDPHRVSEAYKSKLKKWATINDGDGKGLQEFSDFLLRCQEAMKTMRFMDDLNSTETLKQISSKLPSYSGVKWCRHAFEIKKKTERLVGFQDLVMFVKEEADLATDPAFSPTALKEERRKEEKSRLPKNRKAHGNSLSTSSRENNPSFKTKPVLPPSTRRCPCCSDAAHHLSDCPKFRKMILNERKDFVKSNGLCYGCLGRGHLSKNCRSKLTCKECKGPHPTVLHYPSKVKGEEDIHVKDKDTKSTQDEGANSLACVCHSTRNRGDVTNCMIVPVLLYHKDNPDREVMVYALLDDGSDTTFVGTKPLQDLGVKGHEIKLNLFTMLGKEEIPTQKVDGLVVRRMDKKVDIALPTTYSRDKIPFRRNQIPRPETSNSWPHLRKITDKMYPYQPDVDVGLLIGCNCPKAIKPREVILGKGEDPYAVRTLLGWGLIGPVAEESQSDEEEQDLVTSNRIMTWEIENTEKSNHSFVVKTQSKELISPSTIKTMFEVDFSERNTSEQAFSQEDKRFMTAAEKGIHMCDDGHYEMPLPIKKENLELPNNPEMVMRRLKQLKRRFDKDDKYREDYVNFMNDIIAKGYAERVAQKDAQKQRFCQEQASMVYPAP